MTQPQLEASAGEAGKGGAVPKGSVLLRQWGLGMGPGSPLPVPLAAAGQARGEPHCVTVCRTRHLPRVPPPQPPAPGPACGDRRRNVR